MVRPLDPATPLCLIAAGAVSFSGDVHGVTPLDIAVRYGCTAIVRAIFSPGTPAPPPRPSPGNTHLLFQAVSAGNEDIVGVLVGGGWEVGVPTPSTAVGDTGVAATSTSTDKPVGATEKMLSPMMLAADSGRPEVVKALLRGRKKGFPNAGDARGYTALHFATMRGSASIAEALVGEGGADPDLGNLDGDTPLHIAVATRRTDVGEVLLRAGASVDAANRQGHTALHFAAALGLAGFTKQLLDRGADFGAVDRLGAAVNPSASGAPIENSGKEGKMGAATAVTSPGRTRATKGTGGSVRKSRRLEERSKGKRGSLGPPKEGRTALHYAAMNGRAEAVRVLLHAGAAAGHRWNGKRESPLFVAARNGHAEVVALLLERLGPGDVDVPASSGETPLSVACTNGHAEVVDQVMTILFRAWALLWRNLRCFFCRCTFVFRPSSSFCVFLPSPVHVLSSLSSNAEGGSAIESPIHGAYMRPVYILVPDLFAGATPAPRCLRRSREAKETSRHATSPAGFRLHRPARPKLSRSQISLINVASLAGKN